MEKPGKASIPGQSTLQAVRGHKPHRPHKCRPGAHRAVCVGALPPRTMLRTNASSPPCPPLTVLHCPVCGCPPFPPPTHCATPCCVMHRYSHYTVPRVQTPNPLPSFLGCCHALYCPRDWKRKLREGEPGALVSYCRQSSGVVVARWEPGGSQINPSQATCDLPTMSWIALFYISLLHSVLLPDFLLFSPHAQHSYDFSFLMPEYTGATSYTY